MKIFDAHIHLNDEKFPEAKKAALSLNKELRENNVAKAVVIHLNIQKWTVNEFLNATKKYKNFITILNINPKDKKIKVKLHKFFKNKLFKGIKLHPRLGNFNLKDKNVVKLLKYYQKYNLPVIIDAFPDGDFMMNNFDPLDYAYLAKKFPKIKFVWAHIGGHYVLDFLMLSKRLPNVQFDFSYSFLYFRESKILDDIIYAFKNLKFERVMYGSDSPDRTVKKTINYTIKILKKNKINNKQINKLMFENANKFYGTL